MMEKRGVVQRGVTPPQVGQAPQTDLDLVRHPQTDLAEHSQHAVKEARDKAKKGFQHEP